MFVLFTVRKVRIFAIHSEFVSRVGSSEKPHWMGALLQWQDSLAQVIS
jgi:hypothetical protein